MIGSVAKLLSLVGLLGFQVILGHCFADSSHLWSSGHYSELNLHLWSFSLQKNWVRWAHLDSTLFWNLVLLILRSCDPEGTIVNWTFSCDLFRCKIFEPGKLVWIPRYFGTLFCWISAPVIQWTLKWIEPSVAIGLVAKNLSLVGSFGFHVILEPCLVDSPLLWPSGHYSELNLQLWSVPLQKIWVWWARLDSTFFWNRVLLILRSCDQWAL